MYVEKFHFDASFESNNRKFVVTRSVNDAIKADKSGG